MSQKKRKISKFKIAFQAIAAIVLAAVSTVSTPLPASAADCSDVLTPLSSFVVNGVNTNKSFYVQAMNETGVPWEMLAAIHYRETNFSHSNPSNGQGIFQFVNADGGPYPPGPVSDAEFYRQLKFMAGKLQNDYVWRGSVPRERRQLRANETNMMIVKDTLFSYNGRASVYADQAVTFGYNRELQPYEGSPYVMNRFDCPRARMGMITKDYGSLDGTDTRYGTFTIFARLKGDDFWRSLWSTQGGFGNSFVLAKSDDANDTRQWVLYANTKQHVPNADIIYAWGLQNVPLVTVSAATLNSIHTGPTLDRLLRLGSGPDLYFADNGKKYRVHNLSTLDAWNIRQLNVSDVTSDLFNLPVNSGPLGYVIKSGSSDTVYVIDGKNGSNQIVARPFASSHLLAAWEGDNATVIALSDAMFSVMDNAIGSTISSTKITNSGQEHQVISGMRMPTANAVSQLYPGTAQAVSNDTIARLIPTAPATHFVRSGGSYQVYLVDGGMKHAVSNPDVLSKWLPAGSYINIVNHGYINSIPTGSPLSSYITEGSGSLYILNDAKTPVPSSLGSAYRNNTLGVYSASSALINLIPSSGTTAAGVVKGSSHQQYVLDNSGKRRYLNSIDMANLYGSFNGVTVLPDTILSTFEAGPDAKLYVSDGANEFVLNNGTKLTVDDAAKAKWQLSNPQVYSDDTLGRFASSGNLPTSFKGNGYYFLIRGGTSFITTDPNIAKVWGIDGAPVQAYQLGFSLIRQAMLTRMVKASGDDRIFVVNNGDWFYITAEQYANLALPAEPLMVLTPSEAPNTITQWSSVVIKNAQGAAYVIDDGAKRALEHQIIRDHWTNEINQSIPTVSDGFLNLLPNKPPMERAIKGSAASVYSAQGANKRWIQSTQTFTQSFAPYATVSDDLLKAMPAGSPIP